VLSPPRSHARRDLGVVLGQLPELAEHVLLRRPCRLGDERRGPEELARWVTSPLHLQDPSHLPIVGDGERDQHDHPSRQDAAECEEVWTHGVKAEGGIGEAQRPDRLRRGRGAVTFPDVKILVIDIGGSHIKLLATGRRNPVKVPSGPTLTPARMVEEVLEATEGWSYDAVSIGYPGPVARNRPAKEPVNLGDGWVKFNYQRAFGVPVRIINDAAMQALGSYEGGKMLFLGLGTGLGSSLIAENVIVPLELGRLKTGDGRSLGEVLGRKGLAKIGKLLRHKALYRVDHSRVAYGRAGTDRYVYAPHLYHRIAYGRAVVEVYIAHIAELLAPFVSGVPQLALF